MGESAFTLIGSVEVRGERVKWFNRRCVYVLTMDFQSGIISSRLSLAVLSNMYEGGMGVSQLSDP